MRIAKRPGLTNAGAVVIVIFILAAAYIYLASTGQAPALNVQGQHTTSSETPAQSLPLAVAFSDSFGGSDGGTLTLSLYQNGVLVQSIPGASSPTIFSGVYVTPGEAFSILYSSTNGAFEWYPNVQVPSSSSVQSSSQVYTINLKTFTLGTYSIAMSDQANDVFGSGGCFNMTAGTGHQCGGGSAASEPGTSPSNLYMTVANSVKNTGYISSFDPIDNIQLNALLVIASPGAASFSGCGSTFTRSSTFYCVIALPDSQLVCQTIGQTLTCGSSRSSITVQPGTLAQGTPETETLTVYINANANNFQSTGSWGPNAQSVATATIKIGT